MQGNISYIALLPGQYLDIALRYCPSRRQGLWAQSRVLVFLNAKAVQVIVFIVRDGGLIVGFGYDVSVMILLLS